MTREEAIEKIEAAGIAWSEELVEALLALGILKLYEPKSVNERAIDALFKFGERGLITPRHALEAITAAGLKIVEK